MGTQAGTYDITHFSPRDGEINHHWMLGVQLQEATGSE
jgi:hypothetical protein